MKLFTRIGLIAALMLAGAIAGSPLVAAQEGRDTPVTATMIGHFDYVAMGWIEIIVIRFGDGPEKVGTFLPLPGEVHLNPNGTPYGTESTLVILDDGEFELWGTFTASPGATPVILNLHETCLLQNGTGAYKDVSGKLTNKGPYVNPIPPKPYSPLFIGSMHGSVHGLDD